MTNKQARRKFIKNSIVLTGSLYPLSRANSLGLYTEADNTELSGKILEVQNLKEAMKVAVDAAISAGASYADCRFTHTKERRIYVATGILTYGNDQESITVGIRSLVNGYWGFASGTSWTKDEMARLANESVGLAVGGVRTGQREVVLAPRSVVPDESWIMPVEIDPFSIHPNEIMDRLGGLSVFATNLINGNDLTNVESHFVQQDKHFLASDGCSFSQKTYLSHGALGIQVTDGSRRIGGNISSLSPAGVGFELFNEARLREEIRELKEELEEDLKLPVQPVDVGRYDTLIGASAVASILSKTVGAATEIDRIMGHEANATGTSYLQDPPKDIGSYTVGNDMLNVVANRNERGGAATVKWDDEGVASTIFPLVTKGVVQDLLTDREGAAWVKDGYSRNNLSFSSRGCAYAPEAVNPPSIHTSNLTMVPNSGGGTAQTLMKDIPKGIYFSNFNMVDPDFQQLSVFAANPACYEIKDGKKSALLLNGGTLFRTPEFWKSVIAAGNEDSAVRYGIAERKGQPQQASVHSVTATPVVVKDLSVIDIRRKA